MVCAWWQLLFRKSRYEKSRHSVYFRTTWGTMGSGRSSLQWHSPGRQKTSVCCSRAPVLVCTFFSWQEEAACASLLFTTHILPLSQQAWIAGARKFINNAKSLLLILPPLSKQKKPSHWSVIKKLKLLSSNKCSQVSRFIVVPLWFVFILLLFLVFWEVVRKSSRALPEAYRLGRRRAHVLVQVGWRWTSWRAAPRRQGIFQPVFAFIP